MIPVENSKQAFIGLDAGYPWWEQLHEWVIKRASRMFLMFLVLDANQTNNIH